jgi:hypothetical protein
MDYSITLTLRQLAVLRLMLRFQKVRAIRIGLQKFRAGTVHEVQALAEIVGREDRINHLDLGLMIAEQHAAAQGGDGHTPVNVFTNGRGLEFFRETAGTAYGADGAFGPQSEQAEILQAIAEEQEGLKLALKTATPVGETPSQVPIFQSMPKGRQ